MVEEDLADVRGGSATVGAVAEDGAVEVSQDVDVGGTAGVVTWEDGGELGDTVILGGLETTEEGGVDVRGVRAVTVAACDNAGVDTGGVAVWGDVRWIAGVGGVVGVDTYARNRSCC